MSGESGLEPSDFRKIHITGEGGGQWSSPRDTVASV